MKLKEKYYVDSITKQQAKAILDKYHYLHKKNSFRSGYNYGLFDLKTHELIGVTVFHTNSGKEVVYGLLGIKEYKYEGLYELGRLCINPNRHEKNITSWFLGASIRMFRKHKNVKLILSYASSDIHLGFIYQACNFWYYGLTAPKKDFYILQDDGSFKMLQRGKCKHLKGEWRSKPQKHRYILVLDKSIELKWNKLDYPKGDVNKDFNYNKTDKEDFTIVNQNKNQLKLF